MPPRPHQHARFVLAGLHQLRAGSLNKNPHPIVLPMKFSLISVDRHDYKVVLRLAERAADGSSYSDYHILMRFRTETFSDRIHIRATLVGYIRTDELHFRAVIVV